MSYLKDGGCPDHFGYRSGIDARINEYEKARLAGGKYNVPDCTGALAVRALFNPETEVAPVIPEQRTSQEELVVQAQVFEAVA
jgi:hypothetical protein